MNGNPSTLLTWFGSRPPGGDDRVRAGGERVRVRDFGIGVRHREDDRLRRHLRQHRGRDRTGDADADEHVGADERLGERARVGLPQERPLPLVDPVGAALVEDALAVAQHQVLRADAHLHVELGATDARSARAGEHDLHVLGLLARKLERVEERRRRDDRRPVLVVVEDRDLHAPAQLLLDVEAVGPAQVLEVDAAERGLERGHDLHELRRVGCVDLEVEHVDVRELLEQDGLPSITGLPASGPIAPSPSTAVPFVTTATRLPFAV
jgi:hypothetical protein